MKKIVPILMIVLAAGFQTVFAGNGPEKNSFQFTAVNLTQNSWDYAYLHFNINDQNTGDALEIPSFLINYEIKDHTGNVVAKGSGLYMNIMDAQLGSEEDYTIVISTMINGQKVSHSVCKKASPKKLAMKIDINGSNLEATALAGNDIKYSVTRPKFSNRGETENVQITPSDVELNIALNNTTYKINTGANHPKYTEQADYQALKAELTKLTADGKTAQMTVEPTLTFKGDILTDSQSFYEVTANNISEVSSFEAVASK